MKKLLERKSKTLKVFQKVKNELISLKQDFILAINYRKETLETLNTEISTLKKELENTDKNIEQLDKFI